MGNKIFNGKKLNFFFFFVRLVNERLDTLKLDTLLETINENETIRDRKYKVYTLYGKSHIFFLSLELSSYGLFSNVISVTVILQTQHLAESEKKVMVMCTGG